jgi:hypothetical protein
MAKLSTLVTTFAESFQTPVPSIAEYARRLREAGLIATGPHGPAGLDLSTKDAANLLLGLCCSLEAKGAPGLVRKFREISIRPGHEATIGRYDPAPDNPKVMQLSKMPAGPKPFHFLAVRDTKLGDAVEKLIDLARDSTLEDTLLDLVRLQRPDAPTSIARILLNQGAARLRLTFFHVVPRVLLSVSSGDQDVVSVEFVPEFGNIPMDQWSAWQKDGDRQIAITVSHRSLLAVGAAMGRPPPATTRRTLKPPAAKAKTPKRRPH